MSKQASIYLYGDELHLSPVEITAELARLTAEQLPEADTYGLGGTVEEVEEFFARQLGKERALFMPTGTLANHLAIRRLAGERRRVIVDLHRHPIALGNFIGVTWAEDVQTRDGPACRQMLDRLVGRPIFADSN